MSNYPELLEQIKSFAIEYFKQHQSEELVYHNLKHTVQVNEFVTRIADHYRLTNRNYFVVGSAAWLHDLGYMNDISDHEERNIQIADKLFMKLSVPKAYQRSIRGCVCATHIPQRPEVLTEQILRDADLYHLGTEEFSACDKLLRKKVSTLRQKKVDKLEWYRGTISFLENHRYHTDYCQSLLNNQKLKNLEELKIKVQKAEEKG